jgi:uncharacterized protein YbjT (DUF2867 family)
MEKDSGIILAHHDVEVILNKLEDVAITFMRPTSFYYNLYGYLEMIKQAGFIAANYGGNDLIPWVSPIDIAAAVAEEITEPLTARKIRYVGSDELTGNQTAAILGAAIGKPDLKWIIISDEDAKKGLIDAGMQPAIAAGLVEMYGGLHNGVFSEDYFRNRPAVMSKVKLAEFAKEFAAAFKQN